MLSRSWTAVRRSTTSPPRQASRWRRSPRPSTAGTGSRPTRSTACWRSWRTSATSRASSRAACARARTGVIGVLVADFEPFSAEILKGVGAGAARLALRPARLLRARDGTARGLGAALAVSRLSGTLIDGAIMVTPTVVNVGTEVPVVAIDPHTGPADLPTVESRQLRRRAAGDPLPDRARPHAGSASSPAAPTCAPRSRATPGTGSALADAGIAFDPALVGSAATARTPSRVAALEMLGRVDRPTAVFAANDLSAIAIVEGRCGARARCPARPVGHRLRRRARSRPRRLPPLSTVRQPMQTLGAEAARMLLALMSGETPETDAPQLPTRLVPRATTAPPA